MAKEIKKFRRDYGVFCCPHVFADERAILLVIRDPDGNWQFLCGEQEDENDRCHHVGVGHLIDRDKSLSAMVNLEIATGAERTSPDSNWKYFDL